MDENDPNEIQDWEEETITIRFIFFLRKKCSGTSDLLLYISDKSIIMRTSEDGFWCG